MKTYRETIEFLFKQLPIFQRVGKAAYKKDIFNTISLCNILGNPEKKFKIIHIAGTNGKGSCSHMLASIFQEAGYKTGLYTSPHLKDFRERIKINGNKIPKKKVIEFVNKFYLKFIHLNPSFFEITVAMSFYYFAEAKVDIAILETGLGGRLDSTNIVMPELSIITNIGIDHTDFLGDTIEKIASEKAGIIKYKTPVIIGETKTRTKKIFDIKANEEKAKIYYADQNITLENITILKKNQSISFDVFFKNKIKIKKIKADIYGSYQLKNIVTVLQAVFLLKKTFKIKNKAITAGFANIKKNTKLIGRWHIISKNPLTIADIGHNEEGVAQVVKQISFTPYENLHFVLGVVSDKSIDALLSILPRKATYYFCKANIPRGMNADELKKKATTFSLKGEKYISVIDAFKVAKKNAQKQDLIFIGGSTFTVAEIL